MQFHFFVSSFCRVGQGDKTDKRQNANTKFHFFLCSFCGVVQVPKTKKWNFISSFLRFVALVNATKRTNDRTQKQNFIFSFVSWVALYKSPKRRNGISFLRFFVLSPSLKHEGTTKRQSYREISKFDLSWLLVRFVVCLFCRLPQVAKTTERQRDKMRLFGHFVLSFVRFVALYKSPKRRNEISFLAFVHFVAFHKAPKRTNEMAVSGFHRLVHMEANFFIYIQEESGKKLVGYNFCYLNRAQYEPWIKLLSPAVNSGHTNTQ